MILPAAIRYQTELATNVASLKAAGRRGRQRHARARFLRASPICGRASPRCGPSWRTMTSNPRRSTLSTPERVAAGHGNGARRIRSPRDADRRRPVAAGDVPGDALHPLETKGRLTGTTSRSAGNPGPPGCGVVAKRVHARTGLPDRGSGARDGRISSPSESSGSDEPPDAVHFRIMTCIISRRQLQDTGVPVPVSHAATDLPGRREL